MQNTSRVLILDFGSQFTQLIARRLREMRVYCEIFPCDSSFKEIEHFKPSAIILSGGPYSVYDKKGPKLKDFIERSEHSSTHKVPKIFSLKVPVLGICYGMQLIGTVFGGTVIPAKVREYGKTAISLKAKSAILPDFNGTTSVWMSHGDELGTLPPGFTLTAQSNNLSPAAIEDPKRKIYAVQFHPEVTHTAIGQQLLENFIFKVCKLKPDWNLFGFLNTKLAEIKAKVKPHEKVICALSGGVDSTVAATMVHQALGAQLECVFVNNGLLRKNEVDEVLTHYRKHLKLNLHYVDASDLFLKRLHKVTDAEKKRKIIGKTFIEVFEKKAKSIDNAKYLVQGTLYPDVIESKPAPHVKIAANQNQSFSVTIKSHHNVGGLPKKMKLKLIEPLRELFKDEVRSLGQELKIPKTLLMRHPFPGPGLAVRIIGAIEPRRLAILREVDAIFIEELRHHHLYEKIWQAFAVFLPVQTVGVMGDGRSYENVIALRAVTSQDGMTADWYRFESDFLEKVANRITSHVKGVNRVVYDITSKPPATIEWE